LSVREKLCLTEYELHLGTFSQREVGFFLALQRKSLPTSATNDGFRTLSDIVKQIAILNAFHMTKSAVNKVAATRIVNRPRKS
jgi:hypothetical protein